jgi:hypothetical protein
MLQIAKTHICQGGRHRAGQTLVAVVFASEKLLRRLFRTSDLGKLTEPIATPMDSEQAASPTDAAVENDSAASVKTGGVSGTATQEATEVEGPVGAAAEQTATEESNPEPPHSNEDPKEKSDDSAGPDHTASAPVDDSKPETSAIQTPQYIVRYAIHVVGFLFNEFLISTFFILQLPRRLRLYSGDGCTYLESKC